MSAPHAPFRSDTEREVLRFSVRGMHCAACAARIEQVLAGAPGVREASVNFATSRARVVGAEIVSGALIDAVAGAGYDLVSLADERSARTPDLEHQDAARAQWWRFVGSAVLTAPLFALAMFGPDGPSLRLVQWALATPVVFAFGAQFHRAAIRQARRGSTHMDTLVSLGTLSAYGMSVVAVFTGSPVYFETAAVIVTLILLGRFFEARARGRASGAVSRLLELGARDAAVLRDGVEARVPIDGVVPGDRLVIRPGEKVPTDARIEEGSSSFDESMFTGESLPVDRRPGDDLFGGSVNGPGRVVAVARRVGGETALAQIVRIVEETQASKAPVQRLADRVAGVFVPAVIGFAAVTGIAWVVAGAPAAEALRNAVAVLVVACPCALGLATPAAILVGSGRGAELGVLFKDALVFERARAVDTIVFDKTGTLTRGEMSLTDVVGMEDENTFLRLVASVENASTHPIARAVANGARERGIALREVEGFEEIPGCGVRGQVEGVDVSVGTARWMAERGVDVPGRLRGAVEDLEARGRTAFLAEWRGRALGAIGVADTLRPGAADAVSTLASLGLDVAMITGDNRRTAEAIAAEVGITRVVAEVLPGDKAAALRELQESGHDVAFVGDGVNDAPALSQADLGMAVGTGSDVAIESGDAVLLSGDPRLAATALHLARRTFQTIRQNLFWAFAYNTAAIPLAASGWLDPMIASGAMALSSVSVVWNSLRLRRAGSRELAEPGVEHG